MGALFGVSAGAIGLMLTHRLRPQRKRSRSIERIRAKIDGAPPEVRFGLAGRGAAGAKAAESQSSSEESRDGAANYAVTNLYGGATALAFSVLVDSGMEHYRGGFYNRTMFLAPAVAGLTLAECSARLALEWRGTTGTFVFGTAVLTGLAGSGFHVWNVGKREGGWRWANLFYGAPLAAPMGLVFAGLFGLVADRLPSPSGASGERPGKENSEEDGKTGEKLGGLLGLAVAGGLAGTAAEAGLLHFRGAFQDPYMFLPVTIPPLAGAALLAATLAPRPFTERAARVLLGVTQALGFAGVGFHAFGVHRNMGGWRNWSQMLLQGPPLPAPPSFTGMALAGEAALELRRSLRDSRRASGAVVSGTVSGTVSSRGSRRGGR